MYYWSSKETSSRYCLSECRVYINALFWWISYLISFIMLVLRLYWLFVNTSYRLYLVAFSVVFSISSILLLISSCPLDNLSITLLNYSVYTLEKFFSLTFTYFFVILTILWVTSIPFCNLYVLDWGLFPRLLYD